MLASPIFKMRVERYIGKPFLNSWQSSNFSVLDEFSKCHPMFTGFMLLYMQVNDRMFLIRRQVDRFLHWLMPNTWIPLYTTVSFTRIPYHKCIDNKAWQDRVGMRVINKTKHCSLFDCYDVGLRCSSRISLMACVTRSNRYEYEHLDNASHKYHNAFLCRERITITMCCYYP